MNEIIQPNLDPVTFLFCMALFSFMMSGISYSTDSALGRNIAGVAEWSKGMFLAGFGFLLFYMRGTAPEALSVYVANILILCMATYATLAHVKFFNVAVPTKTLVTIFVLSALGTTYGHFQATNKMWLVLSISLSLAALLFMIISMIVRNTEWRIQKSTWASLMSMTLMCAALLFRSWKVLTSDGSTVALLSKSSAQLGFLVAGALCIMGTSMGFILMVHEKHRKDILESSKRDGLTGLYHRSAFFELAEKVQEKDEIYSVLMVDIDHFKNVNDTYGHGAGDVAITHVARLIANNVRNTDLAGRYGGEEFCILLKDCGRDEATKFAQRLVEEAARQRIRIPEGREISITISAGYATRPETRRKSDPQPTAKELVDSADQALLTAKRTGRNKAVSA